MFSVLCGSSLPQCNTTGGIVSILRDNLVVLITVIKRLSGVVRSGLASGNRNLQRRGDLRNWRECCLCNSFQISILIGQLVLPDR